MSESHSVRIRGKRWDAVQKQAWKLSQEAGKIIKPTDLVDAAIALKIKDLSVSDVEMAKRTRE